MFISKTETKWEEEAGRRLVAKGTRGTKGDGRGKKRLGRELKDVRQSGKR